MTSASLQNVWSSVKPKVLALFAKTSASKPFSPAEYSALYTEAYNYVCDSGADLCGFYMGVLDLIDEYCDSVRNKFLASPADTPSSAAQLLAFYNTRMKTLFTQCAFLDRVFRPLVTIFVEKMNKDSTTVLCFAHKSKFIWKARVLQQSGVSEKLIAATFRLIEKEHDITLAAAATSSSSIQGKAQSQVSVSYAMLIKDSISGLCKKKVIQH